MLIVDDDEINREMLTVMLEDEYPIEIAVDGEAAVDVLRRRQEEILVVLLDLLMPKIDGFGVLEIMKAQGWLDKIPVLVISAESANNAEYRCLELGVSDFIHKPYDHTIVKNRITNTVNLFRYKNELEDKVAEQTEELRKQYELLKRQRDRLKESNVRIIDLLGTVVESRNLESGEHIQRVKGFTRILAEQLMKDCPEYGLTPEKIDGIVMASALHDVGKIAIPDSVLLKPGKLTFEEFEYMKTHTIKGCEILDNAEGIWEEGYGDICYEICRHHHERYDGRGYPDGLAGEDIPLSAQLVGVADVYDALVSVRVYKPPFTLDQAYHMILNGECGMFSPKLMSSFRRCRGKFEALARMQHGNENKEKGKEAVG